MAKRTCIFCGSTPVSREHVFPEWLTEVLAADHRKGVAPYTHTRTTESHGVVESGTTHQSRSLLDFVAKRVCRRCNGGWMSDIESAAKPLLTPMIQGRGITLSTQAQRSVATWASLRTMVAAYQHVPRMPVPKDWLRHMYAHHSPPDTWHIWCTLYTGDHLLHYAGHELNPEPEAESSGMSHGGMEMTLVVGRLVFKVAGIRGARLEAARTKLAQMWPIAGDVRHWPPEVHIGDEPALDALSNWRIPFVRPQ